MARLLALFSLLLLPAGWSRAAEPIGIPVDPAIQHAEHERLAGEMEQLARRQVWEGLEDKFQQLEELGVELHFDDLLHGAYSARALGNALAARERLEAASSLREDDELIDWMRSIDSHYGRVVLSTNPPRSTELLASTLPFAPDERAAVQHAVQMLSDDGAFEGLLPEGDYQLADTLFEVEPGIELRIEVSTRRNRSARKAEDDR